MGERILHFEVFSFILWHVEIFKGNRYINYLSWSEELSECLITHYLFEVKLNSILCFFRKSNLLYNSWINSESKYSITVNWSKVLHIVDNSLKRQDCALGRSISSFFNLRNKPVNSRTDRCWVSSLIIHPSNNSNGSCFNNSIWSIWVSNCC